MTQDRIARLETTRENASKLEGFARLDMANAKTHDQMVKAMNSQAHWAKVSTFANNILMAA